MLTIAQLERSVGCAARQRHERPQALATSQQPQQAAPPEPARTRGVPRRLLMTAGIAGWALAQAPLPAAAAAGGATATADTQLALEQAAAAAYADRDFQRAVEALNRLLALEPQSLRWREMRAQASACPAASCRAAAGLLALRPDSFFIRSHCAPWPSAPPKQALVDGKNFSSALTDFDFVLSHLPSAGAEVDRARLLAGGARRRGDRWSSPAWLAQCKRSACPPRPTCAVWHAPLVRAGRGLAYEGLGDWAAALKDYQEAMAGALDAGQLPDPYVANSIGNCYVSLGAWPIRPLGRCRRGARRAARPPQPPCRLVLMG